jgi:transcriptional regulator with XRE-family HTH domain
MRQMTRSLGRTIRAARERRRLTRFALARRCGISPRHLASIEAGSNFSIAVFIEILRELQDPALVGSVVWAAMEVARSASSDAENLGTVP